MAGASDRIRSRNQDLSDAHTAWGGADRLPLVQMADFRRATARLPYARRLARAAVTDPRTFWITAVAVRRYRALQKPLELFAYLRFLRRRQIARCMEIGTLWGGTFSAHCAITEPTGQLIAVDSFPQENASQVTSRFTHLARANQNVTCIWKDSHSDAAASEVAAALNGASLDLLFIDGDHSAEGVKRDYQMYAPFVRPGGVVAFHDIEAEDRDGVPTLWRSLRRRHESVEFVDRVHPPYGLGIGAIVKGEESR